MRTMKRRILAVVSFSLLTSIAAVHLPNSTARTTTRNLMRLWPGGVVPYRFEQDLPQYDRQQLLLAMEHVSNRTCITFKQKTSSDADWVLFSDNEDGCFSEHLGRFGGQQIVNMAPACHPEDGMFGIAVHEILHVLGIGHEQNRPDRDEFVEVLFDNIVERPDTYFKESHYDFDSQGTPYDFGSVMHYAVYNSFGVEGKPTMKLKIPFSGEVGQRKRMSWGDTQRVKRMYSCPGKGIAGNLNVIVKKVVQPVENLDFNLDNEDDVSDPYVAVTAVKSGGKVVTKRTKVVENNLSPSFFERLTFGEGKWQFIRVQMFDRDPNDSSDQALSLRETFTLSTKQRKIRYHCFAPGREPQWCALGELKFITVIK
mmetsp:Transcript_53128/g.130229  ORF Transcript_53128/g.130229 Transcript_53128/m.130229 type:complete len:369 (+) Transcript_53128:227-1333(+)